MDPMTGKSGRDIEVFTEAVQLPIAERAAFLDRACAGDEDLRRRIEALLRSNDRSTNGLRRRGRTVKLWRFGVGCLARSMRIRPRL